MKKIEIYGVSCSTCDKLYNMVKKIVSELNLDITVEKIEDLNKMMLAGVMRTPGLAFDGKLILQGKLPTEATLRHWIENGQR